MNYHNGHQLKVILTNERKERLVMGQELNWSKGTDSCDWRCRRISCWAGFVFYCNILPSSATVQLCKERFTNSTPL